MYQAMDERLSWRHYDGTPYGIRVDVAEDDEHSGFIARTHDHPSSEVLWARGYTMADAIENCRSAVENDLCRRVEIGPNG